jgi:PAS domain S-box-containing protein
MDQAPDMYSEKHCEKTADRGHDFSVLNNAIATFNTKAQELERSYGMLQNQVEKLNGELESKNRLLEENLSEKERVKDFLGSILESLPTGVVVTDLDGNLLMYNSAVEKITGVCLTGLTENDFISWLNRLRDPAGKQKNPVGVMTHEIEYKRTRLDLRNLKVFQSPVTDNGGRVISELYIVQDQTHLKKLENQSERDKRLKAMGEMAITIAHEVRNPLGSIELLASILRKELDMEDDLKRMADRIITEVKSLDNSISNLLLFTRPQQPQLNHINVNAFLEEFVEFIGPVVSKNGVELYYTTEHSDFFIAGDRDLLKQIFLNLTLNALQAIPEHGTISIDLHSYDEQDGGVPEWAEIIFSDSGSGIDPVILNKIFHPFFSTKDNGTGLGLAIVHNIIESHHGTIEVRSRCGEGTTFQILLPLKK